MVNTIDIEQLANKHGLSMDKYGTFLSRWANALLTYGTPVSFLDGTKYEEGLFLISSEGYPVMTKSGGNFDLRRVLMQKQKEDQEKYGYKFGQDPSTYGVRIDVDCFLCQNITQGFDAMSNPGIDNVVVNLGDYFIMPNRYPGSAGHSLWVPINHDDNSHRVIPTRDENEPGRPYLIPEEGKTRGAILTVRELDSLVAATFTYNLMAVRNHVLDGMSIPGHDHFHLMAEDIPSYSFAKDLFADKSTEYMKGVYRIGSSTPFDTLAITADADGSFTDIAAHILGNMERDNQVFTLYYNDGNFLVSPRRTILDNKRIQIGAGIHAHSFDCDKPEFYKAIETYVPRNGEYSWEKYID